MARAGSCGAVPRSKGLSMAASSTSLCAERELSKRGRQVGCFHAGSDERILCGWRNASARWRHGMFERERTNECVRWLG